MSDPVVICSLAAVGDVHDIFAGPLTVPDEYHALLYQGGRGVGKLSPGTYNAAIILQSLANYDGSNSTLYWVRRGQFEAYMSLDRLPDPGDPSGTLKLLAPIVFNVTDPGVALAKFLKNKEQFTSDELLSLVADDVRSLLDPIVACETRQNLMASPVFQETARGTVTDYVNNLLAGRGIRLEAVGQLTFEVVPRAEDPTRRPPTHIEDVSPEGWSVGEAPAPSPRSYQQQRRSGTRQPTLPGISSAPATQQRPSSGPQQMPGRPPVPGGAMAGPTLGVSSINVNAAAMHRGVGTGAQRVVAPGVDNLRRHFAETLLNTDWAHFASLPTQAHRIEFLRALDPELLLSNDKIAELATKIVPDHFDLRWVANFFVEQECLFDIEQMRQFQRTIASLDVGRNKDNSARQLDSQGRAIVTGAVEIPSGAYPAPVAGVPSSLGFDPRFGQPAPSGPYQRPDLYGQQPPGYDPYQNGGQGGYAPQQQWPQQGYGQPPMPGYPPPMQGQMPGPIPGYGQQSGYPPPYGYQGQGYPIPAGGQGYGYENQPSDPNANFYPQPGGFQGNGPMPGQPYAPGFPPGYPPQSGAYQQPNYPPAPGFEPPPNQPMAYQQAASSNKIPSYVEEVNERNSGATTGVRPGRDAEAAAGFGGGSAAGRKFRLDSGAVERVENDDPISDDEPIVPEVPIAEVGDLEVMLNSTQILYDKKVSRWVVVVNNKSSYHYSHVKISLRADSVVTVGFGVIKDFAVGQRRTIDMRVAKTRVVRDSSIRITATAVARKNNQQIVFAASGTVQFRPSTLGQEYLATVVPDQGNYALLSTTDVIRYNADVADTQGPGLNPDDMRMFTLQPDERLTGQMRTRLPSTEAGLCPICENETSRRYSTCQVCGGILPRWFNKAPVLLTPEFSSARAAIERARIWVETDQFENAMYVVLGYQMSIGRRHDNDVVLRVFGEGGKVDEKRTTELSRVSGSLEYTQGAARFTCLNRHGVRFRGRVVACDQSVELTEDSRLEFLNRQGEAVLALTMKVLYPSGNDETGGTVGPQAILVTQEDDPRRLVTLFLIKAASFGFVPSVTGASQRLVVPAPGESSGGRLIFHEECLWLEPGNSVGVKMERGGRMLEVQSNQLLRLDDQARLDFRVAALKVRVYHGQAAGL